MYNTLVVEVFKTNVQNQEAALILLNELHTHFPDTLFNFDLDDCDKILRAECNPILPAKIIEFLNSKGYWCEVLE
jgi:hypothetical protein